MRQMFWCLTQAAVFCGLIWFFLSGGEFNDRLGAVTFISFCLTALFAGICMRLSMLIGRIGKKPDPDSDLLSRPVADWPLGNRPKEIGSLRISEDPRKLI